MASSEAADKLPPSKKRVALRQITKEESPESDNESEGAVAGTFQRASDEVLAERRIVKVRRTSAAAASGPNPFAGVRLLPPSASPEEPARASMKSVPATGNNVNGNGAVEKTVDIAGKYETDNASVAVTEGPVNADESQKLGNPATGTPEAYAEKADDVVMKTSLATGDHQDERKHADTNAVDGTDEPKAKEIDVVGSSGTTSSTFEQLSSAKNAFAVSFGTGFSSGLSNASSTSTSSASTAFAFGQPFTFGAQRFGSSMTFGAGHSQALASAKGTDGTFPEIASVFGKGSNGIGISPLFNTIAPLAATPKPALVSLQEIPVETGEEKEKAIFTADASLFEFLDGVWKERGKGELKLNVSEVNQGRPRLVMRSKGNYRLLLNASLYPDMKISKMENKGISFVCANSTAEGKTGLSTYAVRVKDPMVASDFTAIVEAHKGSLSTEPRTPESSPKDAERPENGEEANQVEA